MSSEIAIKVENLSKSYEIYNKPHDRLKQLIYPSFQGLLGRSKKQYYSEFWALRDIDFEVKKGESIGIIGRNGSGKSTLLQIITGTLSPTTGSVTTNGRIAALLELGSGFNPEFTGSENVYLNGALLGFSRQQIEQKFDAIASFADIGDHLHQPVKTYSSGMLVRLAFAVQVQIEPDILIVDEALAVGDALFQKRCFQRIEKLVSNGTTLLFVSHEQESVRTLTNRALLLNRGIVSAWGLSSEVIFEYRRQLHADESAQYTNMAKILSEKTESQPQVTLENVVNLIYVDNEYAGDAKAFNSHEITLDTRSFGDGLVKILKAETLDVNGENCFIFYPGDKLNIRVTCESSIVIDKLNLSIRIRNKEGVKIYSWGTLNQDATRRNNKTQQDLFWTNVFVAEEKIIVDFWCDCPLGENLYEVQAAVSYEETLDYMGQRILHWMDEAAFFQVAMKRNEYFFGGVVDLRMQALW